MCDIEIFYKNKSVKTRALIDTGNLLKDEISNLSVVIVEKNILTGLIDKSILDNIDNILAGKWLQEFNSRVYDYKFRIIPFSSLGNKNGLILGFRPDFIKIFTEEEVIKKEVIIGIYEDALSGEYSAIIGL